MPSFDAVLEPDMVAIKNSVDNAKKELADWQKQNGNQYLGKPIADDATFAQLKAKALKISGSMQDDSQTQQAQKLLASFSSCVAPVDQAEQKKAKEELLKPSK